MPLSVWAVHNLEVVNCLSLKLTRFDQKSLYSLLGNYLQGSLMTELQMNVFDHKTCLCFYKLE